MTAQERPSDPLFGERGSTGGSNGGPFTFADGPVLAPRARPADQCRHAGEYMLHGSMYSVLFGANYRVNDAVIAQVGLKHRGAMYRFSYDINTSPLKAYTNNNGAFEFSIIYQGTHSGRERTDYRAFALLRSLINQA